jgi:hypothetical protein
MRAAKRGGIPELAAVRRQTFETAILNSRRRDRLEAPANRRQSRQNRFIADCIAVMRNPGARKSINLVIGVFCQSDWSISQELQQEP